MDIKDINKLFTDEELPLIYLQLEQLDGEPYSLKELSQILHVEEKAIINHLVTTMNKIYNYFKENKNSQLSDDVVKVRLKLNRARTW